MIRMRTQHYTLHEVPVLGAAFRLPINQSTQFEASCHYCDYRTESHSRPLNAEDDFSAHLHDEHRPETTVTP